MRPVRFPAPAPLAAIAMPAARPVLGLLFGLVALALVAPVSLEAQQTALTLSSGWKFGGSMGVREGDLNVAAAVPYAA